MKTFYLPVTEGVYLRKIGVDPYSGDLFHETPLGLILFDLIQKYLPSYGIWLLFVVTDLATALLLGIAATDYIKETVSSNSNLSHNFCLLCIVIGHGTNFYRLLVIKRKKRLVTKRIAKKLKIHQ